MLDKWDRRFLDLAGFIAGWSKDPSTKVGAVIAHPKNRRIVSTGFNGLPAGVEDSESRLLTREIKYEMMAHAEQNALLFAGPQAMGCTLYVTPLPPCARCAVLIIQAGIARVVCPEPGAEKPALEQGRRDWSQTFQVSQEMFEEANVRVDFAAPGDLTGTGDD